jgi:hypothetical protein
MSAEIAREMGKGNNAFLLDPAAQMTPEEALEGKFRDYDLDGNTSGEQAALDDGMGGGNYFRNQFNFSRAFVGQMSVAGDYPLSKTANQAFSIDYGSPFDTGAEHGWVTRSWYIINDKRPFGDYLTNKDLGNNYPIMHNAMTGQVRANKLAYGERQDIEFFAVRSTSNKDNVASINDPWIVRGSNSSDEIRPPNDKFFQQEDRADSIMHGNQGDDTFFDYKQNTNLTIHIKDFGDDVGYIDKISLKFAWEEGKPWDKKYYIYDFRLDPNSQTPTIQRRKCETDSTFSRYRITNCDFWQDSVSVEGERSEVIKRELEALDTTPEIAFSRNR